jgi:hypothetical protein
MDWLAVLGEVCSRFNWCCHAYCEMTNHYHVVVETPDANLSNVREGVGGPSVWEGLRHQVFLGSEAFVERHSASSRSAERLREVPRAQRRPLAKLLEDFAYRYPDRREGNTATAPIVGAAHRTG